jgi:hypothetical protein
MIGEKSGLNALVAGSAIWASVHLISGFFRFLALHGDSVFGTLRRTVDPDMSNRSRWGTALCQVLSGCVAP